MAKSISWYILRKKKLHKKAWMSTEDNNGGWRIISMVRKKHFTTSREGKSTLQEVGVSLSTSKFKRSCNQSKYRRFTTKCKQGQIRLCQKKNNLQKPDHFRKSSLWTAEIKINLYQNDRKKKSTEKAWNS